MGALIGTQAGRELEIVNSFELAGVLDNDSQEWSINQDFFTTRQNQCTSRTGIPALLYG